MKDYKKLNLPLLTKQDEEYQILIDVAELFTKQKAKTTERKSGDATEIAIRNHLISHSLRMALNPELTVRGYDNKADRIDGLLLKDGTDPNKLVYEPHEVDAVIEIKNNGVAEQSSKIHRKFKELEDISKSFRFAVIVLSERLLSPTPYCYAIYEEDVNIQKCRVFTCILRRKYLRLREKAVIVESQENGQLWKSGEWIECTDYLKKQSVMG
ncbi:MAG: hypothetical protein ABSB71_12455 [Candidatus Bathyarchaeia archaeon]|jgi:hypothetical protein